MGFFSECKKSASSAKQPIRSLSSAKQPNKSSSSEEESNQPSSSDEQEEQPEHIHDLKVTLETCLACDGCYDKVKKEIMKINGTEKVDLVKKEDYDLFIRVTTFIDPETICKAIEDNKRLKAKSAELMNPDDNGTVTNPPVNSAASSSGTGAGRMITPASTARAVAPSDSISKPSGKASTKPISNKNCEKTTATPATKPLPVRAAPGTRPLQVGAASSSKTMNVAVAGRAMPPAPTARAVPPASAAASNTKMSAARTKDNMPTEIKSKASSMEGTTPRSSAVNTAVAGRTMPPSSMAKGLPPASAATGNTRITKPSGKASTGPISNNNCEQPPSRMPVRRNGCSISNSNDREPSSSASLPPENERPPEHYFPDQHYNYSNYPPPPPWYSGFPEYQNYRQSHPGYSHSSSSNENYPPAPPPPHQSTLYEAFSDDNPNNCSVM